SASRSSSAASSLSPKASGSEPRPGSDPVKGPSPFLHKVSDGAGGCAARAPEAAQDALVVNKRERGPVADQRAVAAPLPLVRLATEPSADRVPRHVAGDLQQMAVVPYLHGVKAIAEQMASALVLAVKALRIHAVQPMHPSREIRIWRLQAELGVVRLGAVLLAEAAQAPDDPLEEREKMEAVFPRQEHRSFVHTDSRHVIDAVGLEEAGRSGHPATMPSRTAVGRPLTRFCDAFGAPSPRGPTPTEGALRLRDLRFGAAAVDADLGRQHLPLDPVPVLQQGGVAGGQGHDDSIGQLEPSLSPLQIQLMDEVQHAALHPKLAVR